MAHDCYRCLISNSAVQRPFCIFPGFQVKMDPELAQKYEKEMAEAAAMALPDDDEDL